MRVGTYPGHSVPPQPVYGQVVVHDRDSSLVLFVLERIRMQAGGTWGGRGVATSEHNTFVSLFYKFH